MAQTRNVPTRRSPPRADRRDRSDAAHTLAQGLGLFSLALGAAELLGAKPLARWLGVERHEGLIQAYGVREIATGIGILTSRDPTPWIWARVGGDALDIATLAVAVADDSTEQDRVAIALGAVAGATVLDVLCAKALTDEAARIRSRPMRRIDYRGRSGYPRAPAAMRGAARDFEVPPDFRIPEPLRPYNTKASVATPARSR
ncbi:MAG: cyclase dehydrase [Microvirga sp.]